MELLRRRTTRDHHATPLGARIGHSLIDLARRAEDARAFDCDELERRSTTTVVTAREV
jgi:hypothetical protein